MDFPDYHLKGLKCSWRPSAYYCFSWKTACCYSLQLHKNFNFYSKTFLYYPKKTKTEDKRYKGKADKMLKRINTGREGERERE